MGKLTRPCDEHGGEYDEHDGVVVMVELRSDSMVSVEIWDERRCVGAYWRHATASTTTVEDELCL